MHAVLVLMAGLLAACAGAGAGAREEGPPPPKGKINIFVSPAGEPFRAKAEEAYPKAAWFARADANHDGALTLEEFQADFRGFFQKLDANHDGVLDGFEIGDYEQQVAPEILPRIGRLTAADIPPEPGTPQAEHAAESMERPVHRRPRGVTGAAMYGVISDPEPVAAEDGDFDGKVSLAEAMAAARRRFAALDADHDGRLTLAELPDTPAEGLIAKGEKDHARKHKHGQR